jgi:hypothetical protein
VTAFIDLAGHKFGRLTAIKYEGNAMWKCNCVCGNSSTVYRGDLRAGRTKSCGCLKNETQKDIGVRRTTHGLSNTSEYHTWYSMKYRCNNTNSKDYPDYGGRGITICDRWLESFDNFYKDMGEKPTAKHSLDRINVNGNYEPSNCRWATIAEQSNNKRPYKKRKENA